MNRDDALSRILASHGPALRRIARVYGGPAGEEEDLVQEILLQVWKGLASFRGDSALATWVYRVALNTALSFRRGAGRRPPTTDADPIQAAGGTIGTPRAEAAILREFLDDLGPVDRSVLLLYLEALDHQQIGDVTGLSAGAVAVRLHRIKTAFEERYVER